MSSIISSKRVVVALIASLSLSSVCGYEFVDANDFYVSGVEDQSQFGQQQFGQIQSQKQGQGALLGFSHPQAAKQPITVDLPSQTKPAQELQQVTNYHLIDQPIKQHISVDQPIHQQRFISQPILRRRTIYTPIHRTIIDQPILRPTLNRYTQIHPHVTEQPLLQQQIAQQDTYVQQYGESRHGQQTQVQQTQVNENAPQVSKSHAQPATQEQPQPQTETQSQEAPAPATEQSQTPAQTQTQTEQSQTAPEQTPQTQKQH